jgi:hypothetical protein
MRSVYRFGGGFNLMKEGDSDGAFHSMEKALVYVHFHLKLIYDNY